MMFEAYRTSTPHQVANCPFQIVHRNLISLITFYRALANIKKFFFYCINLIAILFQAVNIISTINRECMNKRFPICQPIIIERFIMRKHSHRAAAVQHF